MQNTLYTSEEVGQALPYQTDDVFDSAGHKQASDISHHTHGQQRTTRSCLWLTRYAAVCAQHSGAGYNRTNLAAEHARERYSFGHETNK